MTITHINIATLNARSIFKTNNNQSRKEFPYFLRSHLHPNIDVLCLQELQKSNNPHLTDSDISHLNYIFPNMNALYSQHTAIICINKNLTLMDQSISIDERITSATVIDSTTDQPVCSITNIYGPATDSLKPNFYDNIMTNTQLTNPTLPDKHFILGDLNLHMYDNSFSHHQFAKWHDFINPAYKDIFKYKDHNVGNIYTPQPTFKQGNKYSTIDYIFTTENIDNISNQQISYIPNKWTDHYMLSCTISLNKSNSTGPGTWRFNPLLVNDSEYIKLVNELINRHIDNIDDAVSNKQLQWDALKIKIKQLTCKYTSIKNKQFKDTIKCLQEKRNNSKNTDEVINIENQLDELYNIKTRQLIIRSNTNWVENGERNNKYFYNILKTKSVKNNITIIKDPANNNIYTSNNDIIKEIRSFYSELYKNEKVEDNAIDRLLANIPDSATVSSINQTKLCSYITRKDLIDIINHSPNNKSPGLDGLGFELYKLLVNNNPKFIDFLLDIINDAIQSLIPLSWKETKMILLHKKGDRSLLANWRPLSLINADAKIFTKLMTNRLNSFISNLINPYQVGFLLNRLISDHGWATQTIMSHISNCEPNNTFIGVLLDQEKAYDRVNPTYLRKVLEKFGFPITWINVIMDLFFETKIHISANGWLSAPLKQNRGLRQGDPLSPLLFNLAFEPLLRTLLSEKYLHGLSPHHQHLLDINENRERLVLLAYADDLLVFVKNQHEWKYLLEIFGIYNKASNAKINLNKTVMFSVTGQAHEHWIDIAKDYGINWHDKSSSSSVTYLGYPLYSSSKQRDLFLETLEKKIDTHINILKVRNLSIRGRALVANSLILSRLWHILRVTPVPHSWLLKIKSKIYNYIVPFNPKPSYDFLCQPKSKGGVNLINIFHQYDALQLIFFSKLIDSSSTDYICNILSSYLSFYAEISSSIPFFLQPENYKKQLEKIPHMYLLTKLVSKLPTITISNSWPIDQLLNVPLNLAIVPNKSSTPFIQYTKWKQYLLYSAVQYKSINTHLTIHWRGAQMKKGKIDGKFIDYMLNFEQTKHQWQPWLEPLTKLNNADFSQRLHSDYIGLKDWHLTLEDNKSIHIYKLKPAIYRKWQLYIGPPAYKENRVPLMPSIGSQLNKSQWKMFWKLDIPHKAIEIWWRFLICKLPSKARLHMIYKTPRNQLKCKFCEEVETDYHFLLNCKKKKEFWQASLFSIKSKIQSTTEVWDIITMSKSFKLDLKTYNNIGMILEILWRQHWNKVFEDKQWRTDHGLSSLYLLISSYDKNIIDR